MPLLAKFTFRRSNGSTARFGPYPQVEAVRDITDTIAERITTLGIF
jgi:excinuclease UvrABC nuclease subunit